MIRVTQERSFAGMGWETKPAIVVAKNYTGPSTQRQAHDQCEYTGDTSTKRKTHRKVQREREGGRQHYGRSQWRCGRCAIIGG